MRNANETKFEIDKKRHNGQIVLTFFMRCSVPYSGRIEKWNNLNFRNGCSIVNTKWPVFKQNWLAKWQRVIQKKRAKKHVHAEAKLSWIERIGVKSMFGSVASCQLRQWKWCEIRRTFRYIFYLTHPIKSFSIAINFRSNNSIVNFIVAWKRPLFFTWMTIRTVWFNTKSKLQVEHTHTFEAATNFDGNPLIFLPFIHVKANNQTDIYG